MAIPTEKQAVDEIIGREKMYTYEVAIQIEIFDSRNAQKIERLVTVEVDHREAALLQAYFQVANEYKIDSIISIKISDWKEI